MPRWVASRRILLHVCAQLQEPTCSHIQTVVVALRLIFTLFQSFCLSLRVNGLWVYARTRRCAALIHRRAVLVFYFWRDFSLALRKIVNCFLKSVCRELSLFFSLIHNQKSSTHDIVAVSFCCDVKMCYTRWDGSDQWENEWSIFQSKNLIFFRYSCTRKLPSYFNLIFNF